jgi:hypothetical protein
MSTSAKTKKYVAALETTKMLPDVQRKLTPHRGIQSELYDFLEELGWWWDATAGEWKKGFTSIEQRFPEG